MKMFDADKTRMIGLPYGEKKIYVKPFYLIPERYGQTDRQTNRQICYINIANDTKRRAVSATAELLVHVCICARNSRIRCDSNFLLHTLHWFPFRHIPGIKANPTTSQRIAFSAAFVVAVLDNTNRERLVDPGELTLKCRRRRRIRPSFRDYSKAA